MQREPVFPVQRAALEPPTKSTSDVSNITGSFTPLMRPLAVQAIPKFPTTSLRRPRVTENSTVSQQNEGTKRFPDIT